MLPKTKSQANQYRKRKREIEVAMMIKAVSTLLKNNQNFLNKKINILEFGSGNGFQIPYLKKIGKVTASDIYTSQGIKAMPDVNFTECSITDTPFAEKQFDLIFSSQVIEHIEGLPAAFAEMKRIGKDGCIYAFSVPTNIWLLLSIPAQYYNKFRVICKKLSTSLKSKNAPRSAMPQTAGKTSAKIKKSLASKLIFTIFPIGHGVEQNFFKAYRAFKIKNWQKLFSNNGFEIIKTKPLLFYGSSEWPIIPIIPANNKYNACSSVLFLMRKG